MKRILYALIAVLLSVPAYAQQWDQVNGSMQVKSGPTAPLVIIDQTAAGQKIASFRNNGTEKCYIDVSGNLNCAGTFTLTGQFLAGDGSAGAPSYSFASETTTGWYRNTTNDVRLSIAGADVTRVLAGAFTLSSTQSLAWGGTGVGSADVSLSRGAADRLDLATGDSLRLVSGGLGVGVTNTTAGTLGLSSTINTYNNVATAGQGVEVIRAQATTGTVTNTGTASIATWTPGAADVEVEVSCRVNITVSTTHSFSCDVTYTDVANNARTRVLPMYPISGNQLTNSLMTNTVGTGDYGSDVIRIGVKASTAITVRTSAGGTFTTVTYTASGTIKQVG